VPTVDFVVAGSLERRPAVPDTLMLMPDDGAVAVIWRAALACDKRMLQVSEVHIALADR
jgi:hypothetical protein